MITKSNKIFQHSVFNVTIYRTWISVLFFVATLGLAHGSYDLQDDKRIENSHLRGNGKEPYTETSHATGRKKSKKLDKTRLLTAIDEPRSIISLDEINYESSNKVSLDDMNTLIDSQEKKEMIFQDVLVTMKISPVESLLEDQKERVNIFERGYLEFLNKLFAGASGNENARVHVRSVDVIHSEFDKFTDHTANVVCKIHTSCESSLSSNDLTILLAEISDKWSSRILELWTGIEETKLSETTRRNGYYLGEDAVFYGLLQSATIASNSQQSETKSETESDSNSKNELKTILIFGLSSGAVLIAIVGIFVVKKRINNQDSGQFDGNDSGFSPINQDANKNLHDLDEIQLTPTRSVIASTIGNIGNLSPFRLPKDATYDGKIERFDKSKLPVVSKYKAPSRKSGYNRILSDNEQNGSLHSHCECWAPPGKLGVAIDTVDNKPVVHRVKDDSPLKGIVAERDIILAIDDIDTVHMSAADVTYLMVKKMKHERKITFMKGCTTENETEQ